ncbi:MAG: DNA-directed RNA polymerase subunit alpha [Simkaniaceae bacterium]
MTVKYGKFELPAKIKVEKKDNSETLATFIAEPFERGYGHTIGNALRRILLTSLEAYAICSIKIEGVPHEYMAVEGIIEDMTHVVLNFKGGLLRLKPVQEKGSSRAPKHYIFHLDVTEEMIQKGSGQHIVTFGEVMKESEFEVVNSDHKIFTVTKPMKKRIDLRISQGRGYLPSERQDIPNKVVDEIVIDSIFSPVKLVNYFVENTRVGQDTDFDRLVFEIRTDGRITPQEALTFATQLGVLHFQCFDSDQFQRISFEHEVEEENSDRDQLLAKLALRIDEIELSVRSTNCLSQANINTIAELVIMPETDMLKFRNFGKKSLNEIRAKLDELNLGLGMDLSRYGINKDNVKEIVDKYLEERAGKEI